MRSPLRRGFMLAVVAAAILPGTASAAATIQPSGAVAFTGNNVGSTVITYAGGTPSTSCTTVTLTGTKIAGTPTVLEFTPVFSGCTTTIISSRPATLTSLPRAASGGSRSPRRRSTSGRARRRAYRSPPANS